MVKSLLGKAVTRRIEIFPFQANKAVWWPKSKEEALYFLNRCKCFFDQGMALIFEEWKSDVNAKVSMLECSNSWVKIFGIPWNLWSNSLFESLGEQCGGLIDISKDTRYMRNLEAAIIKVRGLDGGFVKSELQISVHDEVLEYRIEVVSVDILAYEQLQ